MVRRLGELRNLWRYAVPNSASGIHVQQLTMASQGISHVSLPSTREKHPHDEHLQTSHAHHQSALEQAEVEYSVLRTPDSAEVPVLPRPEVLLLSCEGGDLAREADDGLLNAGKLLGGCARLLGKVGTGFVLDLLN